MASTVWKYKLQGRTTQEIEMPWGARILRIGVKDVVPYLWVLVDPNQKTKKSHDIRLYSTGEAIPDPDKLTYIGSIAGEEHGKSVVLHCFEALRIIV